MLINDYRAGKRVETWERLRGLGDAVRNPRRRSGAMDVARETMSRARQNVEVLVERLTKAGYQFEQPEAAHVPPSALDAKLIREIEKTVGPMPMSFRAFYEIVGSVNFCQSQDQLIKCMDKRRRTAKEIEILGEQDPLYVLPVSALHADLMAAHASTRKIGRYARFGWREGGESRWYCFFAPDEFHKASYSGGENYNLFIPDPAADFQILDLFLWTSESEEEPDREWFVDYLRNVFLGGGFRGTYASDDSTKRTPNTPLIRRLNKGMLEI
jgi:hypothetical protein